MIIHIILIDQIMVNLNSFKNLILGPGSGVPLRLSEPIIYAQQLLIQTLRYLKHDRLVIIGHCIISMRQPIVHFFEPVQLAHAKVLMPSDKGLAPLVNVFYLITIFFEL